MVLLQKAQSYIRFDNIGYLDVSLALVFFSVDKKDLRDILIQSCFILYLRPKHDDHAMITITEV